MATLATWPLPVRQTDVTVDECAVSLCRQQPVSKSHRRTEQSSDPLAARPPHYIGKTQPSIPQKQANHELDWD